MRFKNSYAAAVAAAVAAVVFSAAFQPAEAALVTIDNFTQATGTSSVTSSNSVFTSDSATITGPFDTRFRTALAEQDTPDQSRTAFTSVGSGVGTLGFTTTGTAAPGGFDVVAAASFNYNLGSSADLNLLALTAGDFQGFVIQTGSTATLPSGAASYVFVASDGQANTFQYDLPSSWAPNQTYYIPFSEFPGVNFASVTYVDVGFSSYVPGNVASSGTVQFTLVAVPEPTHMVLVAGIGAGLGAWRLRKLRRSREAAGDAIAG
jgi:hypothetical protein